jgi:GMP synthase (glutamine-hydrolysing)
MFERLLAGEDFDYATYNVVDGDFPGGPEACDGWLITGSRHGAYEDHDWIPPLEDLIRAIRDAGRPLVGVCFGHQIIAQALGGKVVKFDGGWSVGAQTYQFEDGPVTLNAWHQDQVVALPDGAQVLASSEFCANAAVAYGDRIYTVQAHPEFTATEVDGLIRKRGPGVVPDALLADAADNLNAPLGSSTIAKRFAATFRGEK